LAAGLAPGNVRRVHQSRTIWWPMLLGAPRLFLAGCSTLDLARITERPLGQKYDSKQIARIVARACQRVRKAEREEFSKDVNKIFYAPKESAARSSFHELKAKWGRLFPSAVGILEKDLDSLLTFFQFDATYWTVLRTTNPMERLDQEFKRRTKAMELTGGEIPTYRCLAYVAQTMEYRWSFHPLSQWASVYTQNAA
jgi:transposase-like protein